LMMSRKKKKKNSVYKNIDDEQMPTQPSLWRLVRHADKSTLNPKP